MAKSMMRLGVWIVAILCLLPATAAPAPGRVDAPLGAEFSAPVVVLDGYSAVAGQGRWLLVGHQRRVVVYDTASEVPAPVGQTATLEDDVMGLAFGDGFAVAALGLGRFYLIDLADPTRPAVSGTITGEGYPDAFLAVAGRQVFVHGYNGTDAYDVADLARPQLLWHTEYQRVWTAWLAAKPGLLVSAEFAGPNRRVGLRMTNTTQASQPVVESTMQIDGEPKQMVLEGDLLAVLSGSDEMATEWVDLVDVRQPTQPRLIDTIRLDRIAGLENADTDSPCKTPMAQAFVLLRGPWLYLFIPDRGLAVFAVQADEPARLVATRRNVRASLAAQVGTQLFATCAFGHFYSEMSPSSSGIRLDEIDVSTPDQPVVRAVLGIGLLGQLRRVAMLGDRRLVVVRDRPPGLDTYDRRNAAVPSYQGSVELPAFGGEVGTLTVHGDLVIFPTATGVMVIDVSDPGQPWLAATLRVAGTLGSTVAVLGERLLVPVDQRVEVYDLTRPGTPPIASIPLQHTARQVEAVDGVAYVRGDVNSAVGPGKVSRIAAGDLSRAEPLALPVPGGSVVDLRAKSGFLLATAGDVQDGGYQTLGRLLAIDVRQGRSPQVVSSFETSSGTRLLDVCMGERRHRLAGVSMIYIDEPIELSPEGQLAWSMDDWDQGLHNWIDCTDRDDLALTVRAERLYLTRLAIRSGPSAGITPTAFPTSQAPGLLSFRPTPGSDEGPTWTPAPLPTRRPTRTPGPGPEANRLLLPMLYQSR
jgi:hypothetical protein